MKPLLPLLVTLAFSSVAADDKDDAVASVPLFTDDAIVDVVIRAPFREIIASRSLEEELPGQLVYRDAASGDEVVLDIKVRARGKFRRQKENCTFPPLRLNFRRSNETLFANVDKVKLVTHCRDRSNAYLQSLYKEYLAYRIFNLLTDWSFRARLLQVRYIESSDGEEVTSAPAFLIEDEDQLATRIGMSHDDSKATSVDALDGAHTNLGSVYQYLIGNTDFSPIKGPPGEACCHNYVLMKNDSVQISVPYDFDVTGLASPPHAHPNPRFSISSVKQRLYRGRCANNDHLDATLQLFRDRKQEILDLVNNLQGLSGSEKKKTTRYIESFYKVIDSERKVNRKLVKACLGG